MNDDKIIWFLWYQGKNGLPEVVQLCYDSWVRHNPDYRVIFLDDNTLNDYINLNNIDNISPQALSDVIRINLLEKYGGVWADATCLCMKPLSNWLDDYMTSGFFAFSQPGPDRMISSWFLAAKKGNPLVKVYADTFNRYWRNKLKKPGYLFQKILDKSGLGDFFKKKPYLWHSTFIVKIVRVYPYFTFHYLFEKLYRTNNTFKQVWDKTPKISAKIPHKIMLYGFKKEPDNELKKEIENLSAPMYKLTHKESFDKNENNAFNYLVSHARNTLSSKN